MLCFLQKEWGILDLSTLPNPISCTKFYIQHHQIICFALKYKAAPSLTIHPKPPQPTKQIPKPSRADILAAGFLQEKINYILNKDNFPFPVFSQLGWVLELAHTVSVREIKIPQMKAEFSAVGEAQSRGCCGWGVSGTSFQSNAHFPTHPLQKCGTGKLGQPLFQQAMTTPPRGWKEHKEQTKRKWKQPWSTTAPCSNKTGKGNDHLCSAATSLISGNKQYFLRAKSPQKFS